MISRWWWAPNTHGEYWPKQHAVRSFDGCEIRYTFLGSPGAPVVALCSGFLCPDTFWRYLAPGLAASFRVLVFNGRGVGASGLPRKPGFHCLNLRDEDFSIEANARDLRAIFLNEGIDRAALMGHSMGVQTLLEAYRQYPERIAAIVPIAGAFRSPLRTFYGTDLAARIMPVAMPALHALPRVSLLAWRTLLRTPWVHAVAQLTRGIGPETRKQDMAGFYDHLSMVDPLIAAKMIRGMHDHSAEDVLDRIEVPAMIHHGTRDSFTPPRVARVMAQRIRGAELVMHEGASHGLPLERADEIVARTKPLLEKAFAR